MSKLKIELLFEKGRKENVAMLFGKNVCRRLHSFEDGRRKQLPSWAIPLVNGRVLAVELLF